MPHVSLNFGSIHDNFEEGPHWSKSWNSLQFHQGIHAEILPTIIWLQHGVLLSQLACWAPGIHEMGFYTRNDMSDVTKIGDQILSYSSCNSTISVSRHWHVWKHTSLDEQVTSSSNILAFKKEAKEWPRPDHPTIPQQVIIHDVKYPC